MSWESGDAALLAAKDTAEAVRNLYAFWKGKDRKYSMTYLAKASGLSSSGYFSDLVSGRRKVHIEHCRGLAKAFRLGAEARQLFKTMAQIEHEKDPAKREPLMRRQEVLTKALRIGHRQTHATIKNMTTVFEVFCAFSLFSNRPSLEELVDYFGNRRRGAIIDALETLASLKMVAKADDHWQLLVHHIIFGEDGLSQSHISFLKEALTHAFESVETWFPQKHLAYFTSSIISVNRQHYQAQLEEFRSKMVVWQSELETSEADTMVRCNVQVYPIRSASLEQQLNLKTGKI